MPALAGEDVIAGEATAAAHGGPQPVRRTKASTPTGLPTRRLAATVERLREEALEAQSAADGRALVELAKGILVGQLGCGPAEASSQLAKLAEQSGITLLALAVDVINQAARDRVSEVAQEFLSTAVAVPGSDAAPAVRLRAAESRVLAAGDTQAVAAALLDNALAPLGAHGVAIWVTEADSSLALAGQAGFTAEEADRWRYVPPEVATCARLALTHRELSIVTSLSRASLPTIGRRRHPDGGRVVIPAGTGGRIHGVLEIAWPEPLPTLPTPVIRQLEALAELCAHTLDEQNPRRTPDTPGAANHAALAELTDLASHLDDTVLVLAPLLDTDGHLADFRIHHVNNSFIDPAGRPRSMVTGRHFLEIYPAAGEDGGLFDKLERTYATGEACQALRTTLTTFVGEVPLTTVADVRISRHGSALLLIWKIEDEKARLANLLQHAQRLGRVGGFEQNMLTGEISWNDQLYALFGLPITATPIPLEDLTAHAHTHDVNSIGRFLRTLLHTRRESSVEFRLQRPDGVTRHIRMVAEPVLDDQGRLHSVRGACQDVSSQHWTEVALAATRDQLADTEAESADRSRLALQLQHAIMPPAPASLEAPGIRIAVRYRPAESESLVGGDWYDSAVLPNGKVLLSVGDVAGHGIQAATDMVVLRNALRGLAVTGADPAQLLAWLNRVAFHLTGHLTATAVCALFDPTTRTLRWARAGHLPPVLVRGAHAESMPLLPGLLLGALPDVTFAEEEVQLAAGDILLMYTDGLVERRDVAVTDSLSQLLTVASRSVDTLEKRLDSVLTYSASDTDDDTCLIGIEVR
ncbi:ANTAR domain-containing protein [Streptomyces sp. WAC07061]|uniref:SpoIIE family protein phosphatase n=1 Tax=Streptomyces sp. WAC07061 TaxID=2487410 RepID=UPI000F773DC3|nr:SpoIIE family protein phosphatase [Streptomyces sp. WAC07061]RSS60522.1 ANTAR domain-containing protein [Streptomyces sp. WAC07061]